MIKLTSIINQTATKIGTEVCICSISELKSRKLGENFIFIESATLNKICGICDRRVDYKINLHFISLLHGQLPKSHGELMEVAENFCTALAQNPLIECVENINIKPNEKWITNYGDRSVGGCLQVTVLECSSAV